MQDCGFLLHLGCSLASRVRAWDALVNLVERKDAESDALRAHVWRLGCGSLLPSRLLGVLAPVDASVVVQKEVVEEEVHSQSRAPQVASLRWQLDREAALMV